VGRTIVSCRLPYYLREKPQTTALPARLECPGIFVSASLTVLDGELPGRALALIGELLIENWRLCREKAQSGKDALQGRR
jgi:hypothetical protein